MAPDSPTDSQVTVCIPTKDRPEFLGRVLRYYARMGFRHPIFIGDSSGPVPARQNHAIMASLRGALTMRYWDCPGLSPGGAYERMTSHLTTPYFTCLSDDDFLCARGLDRCVEFLRAHPDYAVAHGVGIAIGLEDPGPYGRIQAVLPYRQPVLEAPTAAERLLQFFTPGPYTLEFSVHRTENGRAMFGGLSALGGEPSRNLFKDELIAASVAVTRGKVKELDTLSLVRQFHPQMFQRTPMYMFDWVASPEWFPSYQDYCRRVSLELMAQDGLSAEEALDVVKEALCPYLARGFGLSWEKRQDVKRFRARGTAGETLRRVARRIPGLRPVWQAARRVARRTRAQDELSLSSLLDPRSPHHEDFRPIYEAITMPPVEGAEAWTDEPMGARAGG